MAKGLVVNAKSSFFYVLVEDEILTCRASKKLKLNKEKIITGDYVVVDVEQNYITSVLPRQNYLARPLVANVDEALLVFSAIEPKISFMLLDKLILQMQAQNLGVSILITKLDLISADKRASLEAKLNYYENLGYQLYYKDKDMERLKNNLVQKKFLFTGQSGVGKSTLINELIPDAKIKTQEISKALNRGKHTTRELTFYPYKTSYIIDTPGFSALDLELKKDQISQLMPDFNQLSPGCKFNDCRHLKEPSCAVKARLGENAMFDQRYHNYELIMEQIKE